MYDFLLKLLTASVRMTVPILLPAIGEVYCERSGTVNLGLEGMMLIGSMVGVVGSYYSGSAWMGLLWAVCGGVLLALVFAFFTVTLAVNQNLVGTALNFIAAGVTGFFFRAMFGITTQPQRVAGFVPLPIPLLSKIPFFGQVFFNHIPLVYIGFLVLPIAHVVLYKTTFGLKLRAAGEHPRAVDTLGVNVFKLRYAAILLCGALAAAGGAYLSLGELNIFVEEMVAGRGFMALGVVVLAKWTPFGVLGASWLFGAAEALQLRMQAVGFKIPYQFSLMLPYLLSVAALIGFIGKAAGPAATGKPYVKGEK
jgi:ABC-type uncharacterized transport system permease subunit